MNKNLQKHLKILLAAAAGKLPSQIVKGNAEFSYDAARELHDAGLITGVRYDPQENVGNSILNPAITFAGRERLAELEKPVPDHAADPTAEGADKQKHWIDKPVGRIGVGVAIVVLGAAALWAIAHWWPILQNFF